MPVVGEQYVPSVTRAGCDGSTVAGYEIVDGDDQLVAAGPAGHDSSGDPTLWAAPPVTLAVPGEWVTTWTFTGAGAGTARQTMVVDPDGDGDVPAGFSHATTADLVRHTGRPLPAGARRSLIAASAEIDRITVAARYTVDPATGKAADPLVRKALAAAVCELVGWWAETGLETGGRSLYTSASIGGVSLGWGGANTKNPQADRVGPKVWTILMGAGLIRPGAVATDG